MEEVIVLLFHLKLGDIDVTFYLAFVLFISLGLSELFLFYDHSVQVRTYGDLLES